MHSLHDNMVTAHWFVYKQAAFEEIHSIITALLWIFLGDDQIDKHLFILQ